MAPEKHSGVHWWRMFDELNRWQQKQLRSIGAPVTDDELRHLQACLIVDAEVPPVNV